MLHLPETDLKKTRFYQEVFSEGLDEGRREAERALVLRQLTRRCGPLGPDLPTRIRRFPFETIPRFATTGTLLSVIPAQAGIQGIRPPMVVLPPGPRGGPSRPVPG